MASTPCNNTHTRLRTKRRLESHYVESPCFLTNQFDRFENFATKDLKTQLTFDDDNSTDSGFQNSTVLTPFKQIAEQTKEFSVLCDTTNTSYNSFNNIYIGDTQNSISKKMKLLNFEKYDDTENIKTALDNDDFGQLLIGDKTKKHVLPLLETKKHRDLASISPETLGDLLAGKYESEIENYLIIDSRYPYEFEGGHIDGALNLYLIEKLSDYLFKNPIQPKNPAKRSIIVFHCEFSSERGPRLMREIRKLDRILNKNVYPSLTYPELYLLEGGYKNFFETNMQFCAPCSYKPMLHDDHRNDLKYFRKKSKSWEQETRKRLCKSKLDFI